MTVDRATLVAELTATTKASIATASELSRLSEAQLNQRPKPNAWSALECFEHLNLYGDFYHPEMEQRMLKAPAAPQASSFKPGRLGNYFVGLIQLKNGSIGKPMSATKSMTPEPSSLGIQTLDRFLKQQQQLLGLLEQAQESDLTRVKTSISLAPLVKLRLGDTLRFVVYHNERHVAQAKRAVGA